MSSSPSYRGFAQTIAVSTAPLASLSASVAPPKARKKATPKKNIWENPENLLARIKKDGANDSYLYKNDLVRIISQTVGSPKYTVSVISSRNYDAGRILDISKMHLEIISDVLNSDAKCETHNATNDEVRRAITERIAMQNATVEPNVVSYQIEKASEEHLISLCTNAGITIQDLPADLVKTCLTSTKIRDITRTFFDYYEANKEKHSAPSLNLTAEQKSLLTSLKPSENSSFVTEVKRTIQNNLSSAASKMSEANIFLERAANERSKIENIISGGVNFHSEIEKIQAGKFFVFNTEISKFDNNERGSFNLAFTTKDVILTRDGGSPTEKKMNFGSYIVRYCPFANKIVVLPYKNNTSVNGCFHPHVDHNGNVCWGNVVNAYSAAMNTMQPSVAFDLLKVLLQTYGGTPYASLHDFSKEKASGAIYVDDANELVSTNLGYIIKTNYLPQIVKSVRNFILKPSTNGITIVEVYEHPLTKIRYLPLDVTQKSFISAEALFAEGSMNNDNVIKLT